MGTVEDEDHQNTAGAEVPDVADKVEHKEIYEEQYDPNQEFRVFGVGDQTKGGVQSLQQKMNMADEDSSSSGSDESSEGPQN